MIEDVKRHSDYCLYHNSDMEEMKDRLIAARKEKKLSQAALAKEIGVNQSIIGSIESGYRKTSAYIPAIANVLGVEALWLTDGKLPKHKVHKILNFDESVLTLLGLPSNEAAMDLMNDMKEFAKESAESRARALQRLKDEKTGRSKESGNGNEGK